MKQQTSQSRLARLTVGVVAALACAFTTALPAHADTWTRYYDNYFYTKATCLARGPQLMVEVPLIIDFQCHKVPGDPKWSMIVLWDDDLGCFAVSPDGRKGEQAPKDC